MTDLISRAALLNDLSYCAPELWQDEEYIKAKIMKQPAVDAIPMEWLEKRRENLILAAMVHSTVYGDNSIELCHAMNVVLDMWQKEQEANA